MKKLLEIIEMAKAGQPIDPEDRRYVRSWVAGHFMDLTVDPLHADIADHFTEEFLDGIELQNL
jgi:hypothetical protein